MTVSRFQLHCCLLVAAATVAVGCGDDDDDVADIDAAEPSFDAALPPLAEERWRVPMEFGFEGSPALCDLDGDGALEAIVPLTSFFNEAGPDAYMLIIEAATGTVRAESPQGVGGFAYPFCVDVDGDGVDDVITAGRLGDVQALSGVTGARIWSLAETNPGVLAGGTYSTVAEAGSTSTLFVTAGGGGNPELAQPDVPGRLVAYGVDGVVRQVWTEPDLAEFYGSPAVARTPADELLVAVGSGGERLAGTLHLLEYDEVGQTFSSRWGVPSACGTGGFVASPVFGDLTGNGTPEVIATDYCGTVHAVAVDGTTLWTYPADPDFATANPLLADLDGDGLLDVVVAFESLNFSAMDDTSDDPHSMVLALSGVTGGLLWSHRVDNLVFAAPVSADFDGDGTEDIWFAASAIPLGDAPQLQILSGATGALLRELPVGNTSGTPLLGDFDDNGAIDLLITDLSSPQAPGVVLRLEFDGVGFAAGDSFSGFRGTPDHDGYRE